MLPFFTRYYLDAAESIPRNSEDGTTELTTLAGTIFDFISRAARGSRAKEWFSDTNLTAIVNVVFAWVQMTSDDVSGTCLRVNSIVNIYTLGGTMG